MAFPRRLLNEGEDVVVEFRPHWAFLGWPLVAAVGAVVLATAVWVAFPDVPVGVLYLLIGVAGVMTLWLAGRGVRWLTTSIVVTTTRLMERSGVLGRRSLDIRLDRLNELSYHQTLAGRLARTGMVMVETGGEAGVIVFDHVPRPAAFQSLLTQQVTALHDARSRAAPVVSRAVQGEPSAVGRAVPHADTPPTGALARPVATRVRALSGEPTVADRLVQLDELRRRGIVSVAEFDAKKAELLRQL